MTFHFFGVFADRSAEVAEKMRQTFESADVVEFEYPFAGAAARFSETAYRPEEEDIPEEVANEVLRLSASYPELRFMLLRAECWGGICGYWGRTILKGQIIDEVSGERGEEALARLLGYFDIDLGPKWVFGPLMRNFPWKSGFVSRFPG